MTKRLPLFQKRGLKDDRLLATALLAPALLYIVCVMVIPFAWAIWSSLTNKTIGVAGEFVGLKNYIDLLRDPRFLNSVWKTILYTGSCLFFKTILGVAVALVLHQKLPCKGLFRALLILPWTLPTVVTVLLWKWLFSDVGGVFNYILMQTHVVDSMIPWLSDKTMAMVAAVLVDVWRGTPFIAISVLAGLQTIPYDLYEAAEIDGANMVQRFLSITLPSIMGVLTIAMLVSTVWTLNGFELIWLLTGGGPSGATETIALYSYTTGFLENNLSKSIAVSVLSMPIIILLVEKITKLSAHTDS